MKMIITFIFRKKFYCDLYFFASVIYFLLDSSHQVFHCKCNDHNKCRSTKPSTPDFYCAIQKTGHCYSARIIQVDVSTNPVSAKILNKFGCLSTTTKSFLSCKGHYVNLTSPVAIDCCNKTDYCNSNLYPTFHHHKSDEDAINQALLSYSRSKEVINNDSYQYQLQTNITFLSITLVILFVCLCLISVLILYCRKKLMWHIRARKQILRQTPNNIASLHFRTENVKHVDRGEIALLNNNKGATSSVMTASSMLTNSTSIPLTCISQQKLIQRTIGHQILFRSFLGKGRFSKVWAGEWLGETVTVKCLGSNNMKILDDILWLRTIRLYFFYPLRHNAVVGLLGSDKISMSNYSELLMDQFNQELIIGCGVRPILIYPYFHWGTLARLMATSHWDLTPNSKSKQSGCETGNCRLETLTRMAFSLVAGLCYLHTEIAATKGKPAIAHRNLKSTNVYVKDDYSCCIGDLEWALVNDNKSSEGTGLDSQIHSQPTIPNGLLHVSDFDFYVSNVLLPTDCRYVAPELLVAIDPSNTNFVPDTKRVEDYKKSDIYSLSLILWELLVWFEPKLKCPTNQSPSVNNISSSASSSTATSSSSSSESCVTWLYEPAYQSELIRLRQSQMFDLSQYYNEPQLSEMRLIVLDKSIRPLINHESTSDQCSSILINLESNVSPDQIIDLLCIIIPQCWCSSPDSRLTCLKIKKYLSQLQESLTSNADV